MNDEITPAVIADPLDSKVNRLQSYYRSGATRSIAFRKGQLHKLRKAIHQYEPQLLAALKQDLNKSELEAYSTEIGLVLKEIRVALSRVRRWAKPKRVRTPLSHFGASSQIVPEPLGTTLIIGPWNYPIYLMLAPVVAAIAAGNTMMLKPSEMAPATSRVLAALIGEVFRPEFVALIEGGADVTTELLKQPFDHFFFTGSPQVGRIVMEAAAKKLIPVTLELGGKSPCIVHKDANIELAARRIVFGKLTNAGQTCVAPDYLIVHKAVKQQLLSKMASVVEDFYGKEPIVNPAYGKIVNERHFHRLVSYLHDDNVGHVAYGGQIDEAACKIAPTFLEGVSLQARVMQEEIFGPIMPVIEYEQTEDIYATVQASPKPLALYVFSGSSEFQQEIIGRIPFGGGCINDTIMHLATSYLPFGGIGTSGIGSYHGEHGFKVFSHYKGILKQSNLFDIPFRYPTSKWGLAIIRKLLR